MTAVEAPKTTSAGPQVLPLTVHAYHGLGAMGLIPERTELLYGQVFQKISKSPFHSFLSEYLQDLLRAAALPGRHVRGEEPLTIGNSEPEPDVGVVRGAREDYRQAHPTTAEFLIEVCVTTHDFDRTKLRAYASAGVKEVWLVLGPEKQIEVYREHSGSGSPLPA
ncbi:MAG TPA: Uma2 family endonuclease [Bryobacteraceae bacterium]|nr:Uma2 family endonuclease [Bryobacteraceae bacterium]